MCPQTTPSSPNTGSSSNQKYGASKPLDNQKFKADTTDQSKDLNKKDKLSNSSVDADSSADTDEDEYVAFGGTEDLKEKAKYKGDKEEGDAEIGEKSRDASSKDRDAYSKDKMKAPRENI